MRRLTLPTTDALPMTRKQKHPWRRAIEQFFVHWAMVGFGPLIRLLPTRSIRWFAWVFARLVEAVSCRRRRMVDANIRAALGEDLSAAEVRRIRRSSIVNAAKTIAELLKIRWLTSEQIKGLITLEGAEHLDAALARGKGAIVVTAHFGNWELTGALVSVLGYPLSVIARDANDRLLRELVNQSRQSKGVKVFGRSDARRLLRALAANECVAILPDQHAAEAAVRVRFLGRPADTATGPATFALRTGAAIVPVFSYRLPDDHIHSKLFPSLQVTPTGDRDADVVAITQRINDVIGEQIRQHPEQWLWLHDRWKADKAVDSSKA